MKITGRNIITCVLLLLQATVFAREIKIKLDVAQQGAVVLDEQPGLIRISSSVDLISISEETWKQEKFFRVLAEGYTPNYVPGAPELPVRNQLIEFPPNSNPQIRMVSWREDEIKLSDHGISSRPVPSKLSASKAGAPDTVIQTTVLQTVDEAAYRNAAADISKAVRFYRIGSSRGAGLGMLTLAPFGYDQEKGVLTILNDIVFEITWPATAEADYKSQKGREQSPVFDRSLGTRMFSSAPLALPVTTPKPVKYVILSDTMFRESLQPFVQWKTTKGFQVIELYRGTDGVGETREAYKDTLKSLYTSGTEEDPPPLFLLIAGDIQHIPASQASGQLTDLYYAEYDGGGDYLPELFYGRFSATDTTEMKILVAKSLQHEQYLFPDPGFLNTSVLIAGVDGSYASKWGNGQINYENRYYFNNEHSNEVHKFLYPASGGMADSIKTVISNGASMVNYTGHGFPDRWDNPRLSIADIPNLQNLDKYPVMIGNGCRTATFNMDACFAEALVRAEGKGALAYIGATNDSYWDEDYYWAVGVGAIVADPLYQETTLGAFDRIFHEHGEPLAEWYPTLGQVLYAGNLAVMAGNMSRAKYYWEIYHLFGDPSLIPFYSVPEPMQALHPGYIHGNSEHLAVLTESYVYGAISADGTLLDARYADESGLMSFELPTAIRDYDTLQLTMTGQNLQPYMTDIVLLPDSVPYLEVLSVVFHDSLGNNNARADYGETISLSFDLANRGTTASDPVEIRLFCSDPSVTLLDSTGNLGPADPLTEFRATEVFSLQLADSLQNLQKIGFRLEIQQGTLTREHYFNLTVYAPELLITGFSVDDRRNGNGNGKLDPGENALLKIEIKNQGGSETGNLLTLLGSLPEGMAMTDTSRTSGILLPEESGYLSFDVTVDPLVAKGSWLKLPVGIQSPPYLLTDTLDLPVGIMIEDFESGNLGMYPWKNDSLLRWEIDPATRYEGDYSARSGDGADYATSALEISVTSTEDDTLSFCYKVSSESGYDFLRFYMDGIQTGYWSGEHSWNRFTHPVPAGDHRFRWIYTKDKSISHGSDAAWIDFITFPQGSFSQYNTGLLDILVSAQGQLFPREDTVSIHIRNYSIMALDSLPVGLSVNDSLVQLDTLFTTVEPLDSVFFTFEQTVHFDPGETYVLKAFTALESDGFRGNDTLSITCSNDFTDAGVLKFESPSKGNADFRDTFNISVWISNHGSQEIQEIHLELFLDGILYSDDLFSPTLGPGDSILCTFDDSLSLFDPGQYEISISATVPFDLNPLNNTLTTTIKIDTVYDAGISGITSPPVTESMFTDSEIVSVQIRNEGNYLIENLALTLSVDGEITAMEYMPEVLYPSESLDYTFQATADLHGFGYHYLLVYATHPGDSIHLNDSIRQQFYRWPLYYVSTSDRSSGEMSVFPNPSPGQFQIRLPEVDPGVVTIEIYNALGRRLQQTIIPHLGGEFRTILQLQDQPDGLYLLKINSGKQRFSGHLIKLSGRR